MEVKPSDLESPKAKIKETKSKKPLNLYNDKPQVQHAAPVHRPRWEKYPTNCAEALKMLSLMSCLVGEDTIKNIYSTSYKKADM